MILGDVEETVTTIETDEETYEEIVRVRMQAVHYHGPCVYLLRSSKNE